MSKQAMLGSHMVSYFRLATNAAVGAERIPKLVIPTLRIRRTSSRNFNGIKPVQRLLVRDDFGYIVVASPVGNVHVLRNTAF